MRIPAPEKSKMWEWAIQVAVTLAVAYSSYKILEFRVNDHERRLDRWESKLEGFVNKDEFREFKRSLRSR